METILNGYKLSLLPKMTLQQLSIQFRDIFQITSYAYRLVKKSSRLEIANRQTQFYLLIKSCEKITGDQVTSECSPDQFSQ